MSMNPARLAILGVALLAGVAAFFLMLGNNPDPVAPAPIVQPVKEETVRVLVATREMTRGQRLALEDTVWIDWPKKAVQPDFITDEIPEARDDLLEAVARTLVVNGEPIIAKKFVKAGSSGLMAAILAPGMRAVTLRVTPEYASGGFILPGDKVDIHYTEVGEDGGTKIFDIKDDVKVLAVDTIFSEDTETPHIEGKNITLEMSPEDAEYFIIARNSKGQMGLTLRSIFEPDAEVVVEERIQNEVIVIRYGRV